jgi:hypothetical protein
MKMQDLTAETIFEAIKNGSYKDKEEALHMIRQYAREQSEQLRNMIIEDYFKDQDPEIINEVKNKNLPGNY